MGGSVPSAIRTDHELASKGLVTVMMESQGASESMVLTVLMKSFPDNDAFACTGAGLPLPQFRGIPHGALIGVDGKLLWDGSPLGDSKKVAELVDAELQKVKKGWGDTAEARKIRAQLYGKDDLAGSRKLVEALPEGAERTALQAEVDRCYASAKKAVEHLQGEGRWLQALEVAKDLARHVEGCEDWKTEAAQLLAGFGSDAGRAEIAAAKKLEKAEKQIRDKKRDPAAKSLAAVIKSCAGTKTAERAQRLLTALETKPD